MERQPLFLKHVVSYFKEGKKELLAASKINTDSSRQGKNLLYESCKSWSYFSVLPMKKQVIHNDESRPYAFVNTILVKKFIPCT